MRAEFIKDMQRVHQYGQRVQETQKGKESESHGYLGSEVFIEE